MRCGDNYSKMFLVEFEPRKEIGRRSGFVGVQTDWGLPGLLKVARVNRWQSRADRIGPGPVRLAGARWMLRKVCVRI